MPKSRDEQAEVLRAEIQAWLKESGVELTFHANDAAMILQRVEECEVAAHG
jgi:hypothetical protein